MRLTHHLAAGAFERRALRAVALVVLAGGGGVLRGADPPAASAAVDLAAERAALAESERAFSRLSRQQGMRAAFLAYLAPEAVIFRPGPVVGRPFIEARPSPAIELTWRPVYVQVAATGNLGFTTGPYEIRGVDPADRSPRQHGYYVTVWRKQADGAWRVVADVGVDTPPPAGAEAADGGAIEQGRNSAGAPQRRAPAGAADAASSAERALLAADRGFAGDATAHGPRAAYLQVVTDEARFYRGGDLPAVGREAVARALAAQPQRPTTWEPLAAAVSSGGDLGYTYGNFAVMAAGVPRRVYENGIYFRIWERQGDGRYKVVLDLVKTLPRPPPRAATDTGGTELRPDRPVPPSPNGPAEPPPVRPAAPPPSRG